MPRSSRAVCPGEMTVAFVSGSGEGGIGPEVTYGDTDIRLRLLSRKGLNTQSVGSQFTCPSFTLNLRPVRPGGFEDPRSEDASPSLAASTEGSS